MGGLMSRNKGKRAEREIVRLLQPVVDRVCERLGRDPVVLQRNTLQSDRGGFDLVGLNWMAPEVKHQETPQVNSWWAQTVEQAKDAVPVLFYRSNHQPWRVRVRMEFSYGTRWFRIPVEMNMEHFLLWFAVQTEQHLNCR